MKEEVKTRWVEALRSGKYKQGRRLLLCEGRYCCLGVLCEELGVPKEKSLGVAELYAFGLDGSVAALPQEARKLAGICSEMGAYGEYWGGLNLARDNDRGKDFLEIATIIEANWKQL